MKLLDFKVLLTRLQRRSSCEGSLCSGKFIGQKIVLLNECVCLDPELNEIVPEKRVVARGDVMWPHRGDNILYPE